MTQATIRILPGHDKRLRGGGPWLYSNEIEMDRSARSLSPGTVVRVVTADGKAMALAHFNPHSLIAARVLTRNTETRIDAAFFARRIGRAVALRDRLFERPFYRLVHAEADGLPGVVIDRFGDTLVVQLNTVGMSGQEQDLLEAIDEVLAPRLVVLRNDSPIRSLEGLEPEVRVVRGEAMGRLELEENGLAFVCDPQGGQKTGWYFDQRENRAFVRRLARGQRVLDVYAYAGGFALNAAAGGASEVMVVDRAESALAMAKESASLQGVAGRCSFRRQEAYAAIDDLTAARERFGLVVCDPPAFVKSRKDLAAGLRGYRKLARGAAGLVGEGGFLCIASCSHNVDEPSFAREVYIGIRAAGRSARMIHRGSAGADHPIHPALPESAYLKFLAYALD